MWRVVFTSVLLCLAFLCSSANAGQYRLPVQNTDGKYLVTRIVIGFDHDPVEYGALGVRCLAFDGSENYPNCYDMHTATDFLLRGGFETMDAEVAWIVAAADGVVVAVEDGHYDRCHASIAEMGISCDGYEMEPNYVHIEHDDGMRTEYKHVKAYSIVVSVGERVVCGQKLALIGSSGVSSTPHLHFRVLDADGNPIDPFAGPASQPESYWVQQDGRYGLPGEMCEGGL